MGSRVNTLCGPQGRPHAAISASGGTTHRRRATRATGLWCGLLVALVPVAVSAAEPPPMACNPSDSPIVCVLEVMRNNALNELAVTITAKQRFEVSLDRVSEYWRLWSAGVNAQTRERTAYWKAYTAGAGAKARWWKSYSVGLANPTHLSRKDIIGDVDMGQTFTTNLNTADLSLKYAGGSCRVFAGDYTQAICLPVSQSPRRVRK